MTLSFPQADAIIDQLTTRIHELIGTEYLDAAINAASRAEAQAERAEAAADNAEVGIRDDTVTKQHLTPGLRDELDSKADRTEVPTTAADVGAATPAYVDQEVGKKADKSHTHAIGDVTGLQAAIDEAAGAATWGELQDKPTEFPPASHTHTAAEVGAATPGYVDSRIQLVTSWPASPMPGVLYLMEEG